MQLKIYEDSKNYACQVIELPAIQKVDGLDNLVKVSHQGNDCLIGKESNLDELYLFFPCECKIDAKFLASNSLYRHNELNDDKTKKGFFEESGRVKALKFKGVVSTGFVIPIHSLNYFNKISDWNSKVGEEFNSINGINICSKYYKRVPGVSNNTPRTRQADDFIDGRMAPHHFDTEHLLKNCHKLKLDDYIAVTYKIHGTSARFYNTLVKRDLSLLERIFKFFGVKIQSEEFKAVCGSRKVIKSVNFKTLDDKNHWYKTGDLWTQVGKEHFDGKLNHGEAVYCEIIGKTYGGEAIQGGYSYQLEKPKVYIYRISNINSQGIEIDLSYYQMKERAIQLNHEVCPEYYYGTVEGFLGHKQYNTVIKNFYEKDRERMFSNIFYNFLLEKPSILDSSVIEEGFCLRVDKYPKPEIYKIKSKKFLEHETKMMDKEVKDIEQEQSI